MKLMARPDPGSQSPETPDIMASAAMAEATHLLLDRSQRAQVEVCSLLMAPQMITESSAVCRVTWG